MPALIQLASRTNTNNGGLRKLTARFNMTSQTRRIRQRNRIGTYKLLRKCNTAAMPTDLVEAKRPLLYLLRICLRRVVRRPGYAYDMRAGVRVNGDMPLPSQQRQRDTLRSYPGPFLIC